MPEADNGPLKAHESIIVLNPGEAQARVSMTLYFEEEPPKRGIQFTVEPERVRCIRMDDPRQLQGYVVEVGKQYAIKLESDVPVIAQYGRLDTSQANMAFYTTQGYAE